MGERFVAARVGGVIRIVYVIELIMARENLERFALLLVVMPAPLTPKRAGPSDLNAHLPLFRLRVD